MIEILYSISNIMCVLVAAVAIFFIWKVYQLTKAKGILWLLAALVFIAMMRFLMSCNFITHDLALPLFFIAYVMLALASFYLYRLVRKYINGDSSNGQEK